MRQARRYDVPMDTAARAHQARPGCRAVVAADLADLRGPTHGTVTLPLRLFTRDLSQPEALSRAVSDQTASGMMGAEFDARTRIDRIFDC